MNSMGKPRREDKESVGGDKAQTLLNDFEIGLSRAVLDSTPKHAEALSMLGHALTRTGRHQEALEADLRLTTLRASDPVAFYNLACTYSRLENLDGAFESLHRAFELGYRDFQHLLRDPDLENLRRDRRFKSLLQKKWGKRQP